MSAEDLAIDAVTALGDAQRNLVNAVELAQRAGVDAAMIATTLDRPIEPHPRILEGVDMALERGMAHMLIRVVETEQRWERTRPPQPPEIADHEAMQRWWADWQAWKQARDDEAVGLIHQLVGYMGCPGGDLS